jgi:hypothetical protein
MDQQEASQPLLELVGLAEIASTLGVSKQRVQELAANDQLFPPPVAKVSGGTPYMKSMIDAFQSSQSTNARSAGQSPDPGVGRVEPHPQGSTEPGSADPTHGLQHHAAARPQGRPLGFATSEPLRALTQTPSQDGLLPRFDTEFFQPEPPEERYRILHAECEQGHDTSLWSQPAAASR